MLQVESPVCDRNLLCVMSQDVMSAHGPVCVVVFGGVANLGCGSVDVSCVSFTCGGGHSVKQAAIPAGHWGSAAPCVWTSEPVCVLSCGYTLTAGGAVEAAELHRPV